MDPTLDSFLDGDRVTNRATWASIIENSASKLVVNAPASPVVITSRQLWNLQFSSDQNAARFGPVSGGASNASTLNDRNDALFALVMPASPPPLTFTTIKTQFGILPNELSEDFDALVAAIDANGPVTLTLDGAPKARSALWCLSGKPYSTVCNLVFRIPAIAVPAVKAFISSTFGLAIEPLSSPFPFRLTIRWTTSYSVTSATVDSISEYRVTLDVPLQGLEMSFIFTTLGVSLSMSNPSDGTPPSDSIFSRLNNALLNRNPGSSIGPSDLLDSGAFNRFFSNIQLWYITLSQSVQKSDDRNADGDIPVVFGALEWQINCIADCNDSSGVVVAFRYDSWRSTFTGKLLFSTPAAQKYPNRQYDYDWHTDLASATTRSLPSAIDVWKLLGLGGSAPSQIPHIITSAGLELKKVPDGFTFMVDTTIMSSSDDQTPGSMSKEAPHGFNWDLVSLTAVYNQSGPRQSLAVGVYTQMTLYPKQGSTITPAKLMVDLALQSEGSWILRGQVTDLKFALLYSYLPPSIRDSALKVFEGIDLKFVRMLYTFHPGSGGNEDAKASSLFISAAMVFSDLELVLSYEYASTLLPGTEKPAAQVYYEESGSTPTKTPLRPVDSENDIWTFTATLSSVSKETKLGNVINTLVGKDLIPDSIANLVIPVSAKDIALKLILRGDDTYTSLALLLDIGKISATLVRLSTSGSGGDASSSSGTKTILRISLDEIPIVPTIPLVQVLPMPFDSLLYLWLDDESGRGLYQRELGVINDELASLSIARIAHKDISKDTTLPVIRAGHHFMVLDKGTVILDHGFSDAEAKPSAEQPTPNPQTPAVEEAPPTRGALEKSLPFLSISAVSLMFKNGTLGFEFDATVRLGPVDFSLLQFDIGIDLLQIANISELKNAPIWADIHGLAAAMNAPPVKLAGVILKDRRPEGISYRGGISLGFQTWKFLAVGEYAILNQGNFKSFFVYAKIMGPLMTIGFASVTGLRMGLGYNSAVRSPAITELPQFPFLTESVDAGKGDDPLAIIKSMMEPTPQGPAWVSPRNDAYWVAAGLTLTAFGILSVTAVLMLQMREEGFIISVFANGKAQLPCNVSPNATLFYVEIGMLSEINTVEGYFTVQAALAPASHVLVPNCRLTGGFALVNWFHPSPHSGDFVFTVGGYHRAYKPPAWYPAVERIGVSFTLGGMINVTGGVYFAITPKCVMGGGAIHMGLDVGPVSAWVNISLDVFIQFKPFHYMAELQVSVGCAISIKVWLVRIRISASVGALLHIEGPNPFGGYANVDFYLFSFTIHFGGNAKPPKPALLQEFYDMVYVPGPEAAGTQNPENPPEKPADPKLTQLKFALDDGHVPPSLPLRPGTGNTTSGPFMDSGAAHGWDVKSGSFSFSITCAFALSSALLIGTNGRSTEILTPRGGPNGEQRPPKFFSKPMHIADRGDGSQPITSTLTITIRDVSHGDIILDGFTASLIIRPLPTALWGSYSVEDDPARTSNPAGLKRPENPTIDLAVGVTIVRPEDRANLIWSQIQSFDPSIALRSPLGPFAISPSEAIDTSFLADPYDNRAPSADRWNDFQHEWVGAAQAAEKIVGKPNGADGNQEEGTLKMAADWLGWNSGSRKSNPRTKPAWVLNGAFPKGLLGTMDKEYAALPRVCGATTV